MDVPIVNLKNANAIPVSNGSDGEEDERLGRIDDVLEVPDEWTRPGTWRHLDTAALKELGAAVNAMLAKKRTDDDGTSVVSDRASDSGVSTATRSAPPVPAKKKAAKRVPPPVPPKKRDRSKATPTYTIGPPRYSTFTAGSTGVESVRAQTSAKVAPLPPARSASLNASRRRENDADDPPRPTKAAPKRKSSSSLRSSSPTVVAKTQVADANTFDLYDQVHNLRVLDGESTIKSTTAEQGSANLESVISAIRVQRRHSSGAVESHSTSGETVEAAEFDSDLVRQMMDEWIDLQCASPRANSLVVDTDDDIVDDEYADFLRWITMTVNEPAMREAVAASNSSRAAAAAAAPAVQREEARALDMWSLLEPAPPLPPRMTEAPVFIRMATCNLTHPRVKKNVTLLLFRGMLVVVQRAGKRDALPRFTPLLGMYLDHGTLCDRIPESSVLIITDRYGIDAIVNVQHESSAEVLRRAIARACVQTDAPSTSPPPRALHYATRTALHFVISHTDGDVLCDERMDAPLLAALARSSTSDLPHDATRPTMKQEVAACVHKTLGNSFLRDAFTMLNHRLMALAYRRYYKRLLRSASFTYPRLCVSKESIGIGRTLYDGMDGSDGFVSERFLVANYGRKACYVHLLGMRSSWFSVEVFPQGRFQIAANDAVSVTVNVMYDASAPKANSALLLLTTLIGRIFEKEGSNVADANMFMPVFIPAAE